MKICAAFILLDRVFLEGRSSRFYKRRVHYSIVRKGTILPCLLSSFLFFSQQLILQSAELFSGIAITNDYQKWLSTAKKNESPPHIDESIFRDILTLFL